MSTGGGFTLTSQGEIEHKRVIWRGYVVDAPVALHFANRNPTLPAPPKRNSYGRLIYALPLGHEVVP